MYLRDQLHVDNRTSIGSAERRLFSLFFLFGFVSHTEAQFSLQSIDIMKISRYKLTSKMFIKINTQCIFYEYVNIDIYSSIVDLHYFRGVKMVQKIFKFQNPRSFFR